MNAQRSSTVMHTGAVAGRWPVLSEFEQSLRVLELSLELLIARTNMGDFWSEGFDDAGKLLASVPLATTEFISANRRLQNAVGYGQQEEFGAAAFELRALRGQLQRL